MGNCHTCYSRVLQVTDPTKAWRKGSKEPTSGYLSQSTRFVHHSTPLPSGAKTIRREKAILHSCQYVKTFFTHVYTYALDAIPFCCCISSFPQIFPISLHPPFPGLLFPKNWERIPYRLGNPPGYSMHRTVCSLLPTLHRHEETRQRTWFEYITEKPQEALPPGESAERKKTYHASSSRSGQARGPEDTYPSILVGAQQSYSRGLIRSSHSRRCPNADHLIASWNVRPRVFMTSRILEVMSSISSC